MHTSSTAGMEEFLTPLLSEGFSIESRQEKRTKNKISQNEIISRVLITQHVQVKMSAVKKGY